MISAVWTTMNVVASLDWNRTPIRIPYRSAALVSAALIVGGTDSQMGATLAFATCYSPSGKAIAGSLESANTVLNKTQKMAVNRMKSAVVKH